MVNPLADDGLSSQGTRAAAGHRGQAGDRHGHREAGRMNNARAGPSQTRGRARCWQGRYRLVERLGEQDGSAEWRATDEMLARTVPVRVFTRESHHVARVMAAARAACRVSDPRLARIFDAPRGPGTELAGTVAPPPVRLIESSIPERAVVYARVDEPAAHLMNEPSAVHGKVQPGGRHQTPPAPRTCGSWSGEWPVSRPAMSTHTITGKVPPGTCGGGCPCAMPARRDEPALSRAWRAGAPGALAAGLFAAGTGRGRQRSVILHGRFGR